MRGATFTCDSFTTCGSRTRWPLQRRQVLDLGLDLVLERQLPSAFVMWT
jgi:hypothetical protein